MKIKYHYDNKELPALMMTMFRDHPTRDIKWYSFGTWIILRIETPLQLGLIFIKNIQTYF